MRGFKNRRIALLIVALILSGLFIVSPWKDPSSQPKGAPLENTIRGPHWGIDITGGSRIMLEIRSKEAKIRFKNAPSDYGQVSSFITKLEDDLQLDIDRLGTEENVIETGIASLLIKESIPENLFTNALGENAELVKGSFKNADFDEGRARQIRGQLTDDLKQRVDPQGTLGAQFRPIGARFLMYEVSLQKEEAMRLLGSTGRLEIFVDNTLVLWGRHIGEVRPLEPNQQGKGLMLPFELVDNGPKRWEKLTEGKTDYPGVIYMDRLSDSVILLPDYVESELAESTLTYLPDVHRFESTIRRISYNVQVPVVRVNVDSGPVLPEETRKYLQKNSGLFSNAIWLGKSQDIPEQILENNKLKIENMAKIPINSIPKEKGESYDTWIRTRVCGVESDPPLSPSVAGEKLNQLYITGLNQEEGEDLRTILSQDVDVGLATISAESVDKRVGSGFLREAAIAAIAAFAVVGILVCSFYKRLKIVVPLLLTMLCEVIITFGAASAVPDAFMSIGLPGLGGLIAVVGTGVDHQIIIADEVLEEKTSEKGKLPFDRRTGKAFGVIFSAAATTVAAMIALAIFGFGPMRGFALITLFGVLVSILITRPAFARIVGILLEREE